MVSGKKVVGAGIAALGVGALALTSTPAAAAHSRAGITISGAGSTFVAPIMNGAWIKGYQAKNSNVNIDYQATGSGAGISLWTKGQTDFAGSDALLSSVQENSAKNQCHGGYSGGVFKIPVTIGAVSLIYNLPGVSNLKLTSGLIAQIFLGQIKTWNDAQIQKINGSAKLPSTPIQIVHRADGSGTTYIFSHYLSATSSIWTSQVGKGGATIAWPTGTGATGSSGVTQAVQGQPGAISYVDLAYAISAKVSYATVQNKAGQYVQPSVAAASVAADGYANSMPSDLQQLIVNSPSKNAYSVSGYSYIFMCTNQRSAKGQALVSFVRYVVTDGQAAASQLYYAPLPKSVQKLDTSALDKITIKR